MEQFQNIPNNNNMFVDDYTEPEVNPEGFFNDLTQNACSVRVAVRVRPLIGIELNKGREASRTCVEVSDSDQKLQIGDKQFQFDRVFSSDSEQREIFDVCARNLVLGCFVGYNATILAYGQTGSGKTHTMGTGSTSGLLEDQVGIVPRVFAFIFEELERKKRQFSLSEFTIKIQFLELYNEELHDLLDPMTMGAVDKITGKSAKELFIKEKNGTIYIQGLKEETVTNKEECLVLLNKGILHRTTSATLMNEGSSRSHAIFTISIEQKIVKEIEVPEGAADLKGGQQEEQITAKFHFVDLAGSERIKKTGATGQLMKEGISINKGLLCLGNVISALTDENKKEKHIPYRDSKLTRILQDSLGGNSRTTMIACVSPAETNYEESLNSIKYASRARNIKNKAVVNRDPNSLLIDSLRTQISKLQGEISEYQTLLKQNGVAIPTDFADSVQRKIDANRKSPLNQNEGSDIAPAAGGMSQGEVRTLKINLSKKEAELKEAKASLQEILKKLADQDKQVNDLQRERDNLRLKIEILMEHCQKNNLICDLPEDGGSKLTIVDEYKLQIAQLKQEIESRSQEVLAKSKIIGELQAKKQIDDQLLNKQLEDIKKLKGMVKKQQDSGIVQTVSPQKSQPKFKLNLEKANGESSKKSEIPNFVIDAEGLNKKIIDNLSSQLDSLFSMQDEDSQSSANTQMKSPSRSRTPAQEDPSDDDLNGGSDTLEEQITKNLDEKEKILSLAKSSVQQLQSELVDMMKNQYEQQARQVERDMRNIDSEKQATLRKATDSKQIQAIEAQYKQKMDDLGKQLQMFKEKEKQKEQIEKQVSMRENKIKNLEDDITKMKKNRENLEKQMKNESEKFSKFKINISKELINAKKAMTEKEKEVSKLKTDLKKTDYQMQQKLSELRGIQRKVYEERMRKDLEKNQEYDKKGIDIDRIKTWITDNTDRMLRHNELKDAMERHNQEKDRIEDEMFNEGDKLDRLMLEKDRKELEKQNLELIAEQAEVPDEGPILELEELIYQLTMEIQNVNETLESLEETHKFHSDKLNLLNEEAIALDCDNIEPLKFSGLQSVDAARVTLQTFFSVMLDVNIYKRDLETKCIESDEAIINLQSSVSALQTRIEELNQKQLILNSAPTTQSQEPGGNSKIAQNKDKAIKNIVNALDGFVEYQDVKNLGLTPNEQNSLTKLSLSKIVTNVKQQLEEEKKRNHNLVLKLEQAINDKEQYKLKFDNLRKKNKDDAISSNPLQSASAGSQQTANQEGGSQQKAFSSLAAARANRRQVQKQSVDQNNNGAPQTPSVGAPAGGKYKSRLNLQKSNLSVAPSQEENNNESSLKKNPPSGNANNRFVMKRPSFPVNVAGGRKSRSQSREGTQQQKQNGVPNINRINKGGNSFQATRRQPALRQQATEAMQNISQNNTAQVEQQVTQKPVVPNLKDRRNQRKQEHDDQNQSTASEFIKQQESEKMNEQIDRIKEEAHMITSNKSHMERRQSRARAFSKKIQNERAYSNSSGGHQLDGSNRNAVHPRFEMVNFKDFEEQYDNEESPRASNVIRPPQETAIQNQQYIGDDQSSSQFEDDNGYGNEGLGEMNMQQPLTQNSNINQWNHEELAFIENFGANLIGCDCYGGKIVLIFDNFNIREIDLGTMEERPITDVLALNGISGNGQSAVDSAVDKELGAIAISTATTIFIFDFDYNFQNKIDLENIEQILFCQYNLVALVNVGDAVFLISYQIDDGGELGCEEFKTDGNKVLMKTDNNFVYLSCGIRLAKFSMPEMSSVYVIETEHSNRIIDFTLSPSNIITTSADNTVKVHTIETGEQCMNSLDELECDHLQACGDYLLTRINQGSSILVFRYYQGNFDLDFIDEINLEDVKLALGEVLEFKMQGNIFTSFTPNSTHYNLVLLVSVTSEGILVNALKHKPLSEL